MAHGKATPSDIAKGTDILQPKELSYDFKKLMERGEITWKEDPKDRRKKWYSLKHEDRTRAESKRYEAIEYIENMKEPLFAEAKASESDYGVRSSAFFEGPFPSVTKDPKKYQECKEWIQGMLEKAVKALADEEKTRAIFKPPLFTKTVMVWVHEAPEIKVKENIKRVMKEFAEQSGKKEDEKAQ